MKLLTMRLMTVLILSTIMLPLCSVAYTFAPSIVTLRTAGAASSCFFKLENKEMKAVAVEVTINSCSKDIDGKTIQGKDAEKDFIIYPAQVVLMPGDETGVQVRWIGEETLKTEQTYTIVARQVPVPTEKDKKQEDNKVHVQVTVLVNYEGRLYVAPKGAKAEVVIESAAEQPQPVKTAGNTSTNIVIAMLEIVCANKGTAHMDMATATLILTPVNKAGATTKQRSISLTVKEAPCLKTHLLAGDRRRFVFPRPQALPAGPFEASIGDL